MSKYKFTFYANDMNNQDEHTPNIRIDENTIENQMRLYIREKLEEYKITITYCEHIKDSINNTVILIIETDEYTEKELAKQFKNVYGFKSITKQEQEQ